MEKRILYIFTRTPLHVGAGSSVGAIDQPIQRERHTGFPIIPASSLKGTFADGWNDEGMRLRAFKRVKRNDDGTFDADTAAAWLFGSDDANHSFAGAIQFSEARVLAFPIRSAKGSFAWITCPLMLQRAEREGVIPRDSIAKLPEPKDHEAVFDTGSNSKLEINGQLVLEEYTFKANNSWVGLAKLGEDFARLHSNDLVWKEIKDRLVILSNGMMSFFARNACEIAQHVKISDETGTAEGGALFNQENVPSETLFYSVVHFFKERAPGRNGNGRLPDEAASQFSKKLNDKEHVFQFGGDASTGLGYCTVKLSEGGKDAKS